MNPSSVLFLSINRGYSYDYCLITGASSGIGLAMAEEFARKNKNLVLVALPQTGLEDIATSLHDKYKISVLAICIDLTKKHASDFIFHQCESHKVMINVLVNNAGFGNLECFQDSNGEELHQMIALNNQALVQLTLKFIPHLRLTAPSYILNTGSLASFFKIPFKAVYSATKSFVYSFSAALRIELADEKIHVSCLCPGGTLTSQRFRELLRKSSGNSSPFLQMPEDVAREAIQGLFAKKFRIVPGIHNKLMLFVNDFIPAILTNWILIKHFKPKKISA